jgi:thymidylate kinase
MHRLPNLIIEGPDRAGKTTVINALMKKYPQYKYVHCGEAESDDKQQWYKNFFYRSLDAFKAGSHIFDRFHLGELVYGKMYRKYDITYCYDLEQNIRNCSDTLLVVLHADSRLIQRRWDGKGIMPISDIDNVIIEFIRAYCCSILKKIIIDATYMTPDDVVKVIERKIDKEFGLMLPTHCDLCGNFIMNNEIVILSDYKITCKKCQ